MAISFCARALSTLDLYLQATDEATMIILAIDTCLNRCAACLFDANSGRSLAGASDVMERGQAEVLAPMVHTLLLKANLEPSDISRIAVTTGPGTFTGIRIGLGFARAFGLGLSIPVIGLDSLRAVALSHPPVAWMAHLAGQSGFAYVLRENVINVERLDKLASAAAEGQDIFGTWRVASNGIGGVASHTDFPDLEKLATYAALQPASNGFPDPVYLRDADARERSEPFVVTEAGTEQSALLANIHQASFVHGWIKSDLASLFETPGTVCLTASDGLGLCGFVMFRIVADEAEVLTLCTLPLMRNRGAGKALIQAMAEKLNSLGVKRVHLEVAQANTAALALYRSAGFIQNGLRKSYYSNGDDAVLMRKVFD